MCDIDRTLVIRTAAYFATWAADREPARPTPFEAKLMEQALRGRVGKVSPQGQPAPTGDLEERARVLYQSTGKPTPRAAMLKLVVALLAEPTRSFRPREMEKLSGHKNACEAFKSLIPSGIVAKGEHNGTYKLGPKGKAA